MEKLHYGWLTKSPPEKKTQRLFPAKWRRRYFVLYVPPHSGILPIRTCAAILDYYSNDKMITKRGSIDLEKCHSIVTNFNNTCYKHIFIMKTVHKDKERDYYLAADSKEEMDEWVNILCDVVGLNKESFTCLTPTKQVDVPRPIDLQFSVNSEPSVSKSYSAIRGDYFDLKDCIAGSQGSNGKEASTSYVNESDQIQIFQVQRGTSRRNISSSGSSNRPDSNEFQGFLTAEDVYNIPRNQGINNDYKMPKLIQGMCGSTSSGLDESLTKENLRSPSSSSPSASSTTFNDVYDIPPPKPHIPPSNPVNNYINTNSNAPENLPLPLKIKNRGNNKKNGLSQNGSSSSSDAFRRMKDPNSASPDISSSSSSSLDDDDGPDGSCKHDDPIEDGVYNIPRRPSEPSRDILPSVFEECNVDRITISNNTSVQKVQYLHLDFSEGTNVAEVTNNKPATINKVEYKEIDFEKTRALSEIRVTREITKSQ